MNLYKIITLCFLTIIQKNILGMAHKGSFYTSAKLTDFSINMSDPTIKKLHLVQKDSLEYSEQRLKYGVKNYFQLFDVRFNYSDEFKSTLPGLGIIDIFGHTLAKISTARLTALFDQISKLPHLKYLHLLHSKLDECSPDQLTIIFSHLAQSKSLEVIYLQNNYLRNLSSENLMLIFQHLSRCNNLKKIYLDRDFYSNQSKTTKNIKKIFIEQNKTACYITLENPWEVDPLKPHDFTWNPNNKWLEINPIID